MSETNIYYSQSRAEVARFLPQKYEKVLEIGCGAGTFRANLNDSCEYWGIEPVNEVAAAAAKHLFKVLTGTFDEVADELPDDYFDLVICNDVIEHIADTESLFKSVRKKMKKDARLVGSIPNVREFYNLTNLLLKKDWEYLDYGILDRTHMKFFTEKSLKRTFLENDFTIEEFHGINEIPMKPNTIKQIVAISLTYLLGRDTLFPQFGFRIKNNSSAE